MHIETKHQSNLAALPMVISGSLSAYEAMSKTNNFGCLAPNGEEFIPCVRCGYRGCDVRVSGCGCTFHARCIPLPLSEEMKTCIVCNRPASGLMLFPMSFRELDEARKTAAAFANNSKRNSKKRKSSSNPENYFEREKAGEQSDRRTGRWTKEEMDHVDQLICRFESGELPLIDGVKLNDFLSGILKSKQSRLTKKMKNAKLSARSFKRRQGYIVNLEDARQFSETEDSFFHSIQCHQERAEIKFHMQKEWRELCSSYCLNVGESLDAERFLVSIEEMDRRESAAKDVARMAKRKFMMGHSSSNSESNNKDIKSIPSADSSHQTNQGPSACTVGIGNISNEYHVGFPSANKKLFGNNVQPPKDFKEVKSSHFLERVLSFISENQVPFEHVDAWVPSFVPVKNNIGSKSDPMCRLCFAGSITAEHTIHNGVRTILTSEEKFCLKSFGEYSEKFSFDVGCGLPGRVYQTGVPTWEQSVQNAPQYHFERCGGASQWGIRTVVGIPVPSPNVGRIVVTFYSRNDREKNQEIFTKLSEELTNLAPCPKWKLMIELSDESQDLNCVDKVVPGSIPNVPCNQNDMKSPKDAAMDGRINAVVALLGEHMPSDPSSPIASYVPGFMAMRLMMLKPSLSDTERELTRTLLESYSSYTNAGRSGREVAILLARDCMFLIQQQGDQSSQGYQQICSNLPGFTSHHGNHFM